jgi:hypothetical protein
MVSSTRFSIVVLLVLVAADITVAQKLNPKRPSVYLTFKDFVAKTPDPASPSQGARLTVHNNTRWPIYFFEHYDPTVAGAQIAYNIIDVTNGCRIERTYTDVVFHRRLAPGKTLDFVVPRGDFPEHSKIYVTFYFSFEEFAGRKEPEHQADFLPSELPPWPQADASNKSLDASGGSVFRN